jgi:hypothetical protein
MWLRRTLIGALAVLATPIVEEAMLRVYRRRGLEARALGIDGLGDTFYRIFGPNPKPAAEVAAALRRDDGGPQTPVPIPRLSSPILRPSGEVVQLHRRSSS